MIKIAIVDDHEIFLKGLEKLLRTEKDIKIMATYSDGQSLLRALPALSLDILLLDVQLPDIEAEDLLKQIRHLKPQLPILYLTMIRGSRTMKKLKKHAIQGYILKDAAIEELQAGIRSVADGIPYYSQDISLEDVNQETNTVTTPSNKLLSLLSPREFEILKLVCLEYSSAEIGEKLFLSTGTVDTHRRNILVKIGASNTVGMVKFALQNGILDE
ncbi:MAG: response regulator transcription factor [Cytophagales bacterium]|nr:response regulator transcription factor [Cytophagales bacterium]